MLILSGLSLPVKRAPPSKIASTSFLCVATAIEAPTPNPPPSLRSSSESVSDELSLLRDLNNRPDTKPALSVPSAMTFTSVSFCAVKVRSSSKSSVVLSPMRAVVSFTSLMPTAIAPAMPTPLSPPPWPTPEMP